MLARVARVVLRCHCVSVRVGLVRVGTARVPWRVVLLACSGVSCRVVSCFWACRWCSWRVVPASRVLRVRVVLGASLNKELHPTLRRSTGLRVFFFSHPDP